MKILPEQNFFLFSCIGNQKTSSKKFIFGQSRIFHQNDTKNLKIKKESENQNLKKRVCVILRSIHFLSQPTQLTVQEKAQIWSLGTTYDF